MRDLTNEKGVLFTKIGSKFFPMKLLELEDNRLFVAKMREIDISEDKDKELYWDEVKPN